MAESGVLGKVGSEERGRGGTFDFGRKGGKGRQLHEVHILCVGWSKGKKEMSHFLLPPHPVDIAETCMVVLLEKRKKGESQMSFGCKQTRESVRWNGYVM